jgi:tetratricopeptide (TPR) repeat protein
MNHTIQEEGKNMFARVWIFSLYAAVSGSLVISVGSAKADTVEALLKQAETNQQQNKMSDAERDYQNALREAERSGQQSPQLIDCVDKIALFYKTNGRAQQADNLYQRSLRLKQQKFGRESDQVAQCMRDIAQNYLAEGRVRDAEPLLRGALQIYEYRDERSHQIPQDGRTAKADCMDELAGVISQLDVSGKTPEEATILNQRAEEIRNNPSGK